jgi:sorting nexin-29
VVELFKNDGWSLLEALHKIIVFIWQKEIMPKEWNTGLICSIFRTGDKLECKNYRGITLLNMAYKVLSCMILEHINQYAYSVLEEYQCGFRRG